MAQVAGAIDHQCSMGCVLSCEAAGDDAALEPVYRGFGERVRRIAARRVSDSADEAEDAVQEGFTSIPETHLS